MNKIYVNMTDQFMSGWGKAKDKINKYVIECDNMEQAKTIEKNAKKRSEMKFVNICYNKPKQKQGQLISLRKFKYLGTIWTK